MTLRWNLRKPNGLEKWAEMRSRPWPQRFVWTACLLMLMGRVLVGSGELWAKPNHPCTTNQTEGSGDARPCTQRTAFGAENVEPHLAYVRQLTFGGKNAEAYFSFDGDKLIFQSTKEPGKSPVHQCYQHVYHGSGISWIWMEAISKG